MDLPRTDLSISELNFCIFNRALHPELFNIYASRRFYQSDYEVIIWVTSYGHVVGVFKKNNCVTELICPPEQLLPKRGLIEQFPFRGEKNHQCRWAKGLGYMMNLQAEQMSANLFRQCHSDLTKAGKKRGMFVSFNQASQGELAPFSYLDYEARQNELQLHTYHAFPDQQAILKTQSLVSLGTNER